MSLSILLTLVFERKKSARSLIGDALRRQSGCVSFIYLNDVLAPLCEVYPGIEFYSYAMRIAERWKYSFYDSLIITAALQANCAILYTEDLQHGQVINQLTITNPFLGMS